MSPTLTAADLRRLRSLRDRKDREAAGLFAIEGEKAVRDLLAENFPFEDIYATDAWPGRATTRITEAQMGRMSHFPTPSCVFAVGRIRREPCPPGALARGLTLALDRVQDPGNVGTIMRIADWFALDRVLLSPDCADVYSQKALQASMASFARVRTHVVELGAALADAPVPVLGCDPAGDKRGLAPVRDAVIVIGSEGRGLSPAVRERVTRAVAIPRFGGADSLNAAVAAGIVCAYLRSANGAS
ncbi:MAG: TrmH family RNA methyltransferase [Opitutaceae bacterium]